MIRYVPNEKIDKEKWDRCIDQAVNGIVYAYSWYLDNVCEQWDALVAGDYEVVLPLVWNQKWGIRYIYPPLFSQQLGVFSNQHLTETVVNEFLDIIPKKFGYIELNLNTLNKASHQNFQLKKRTTHHLELIEDYVSLARNYSENTARNLKKAEKNNLQVVNNLKPESLVELFQQNQGKRLTYIRQKHYYSLLRVMYQAIHKNAGQIIGVYDDKNSFCSGGFFIKSHYKIINLFPATSQSARDNGAMFLLIDNLIRANAGTRQILDFEGSMVESIARFYKGFGSKEVYYWHARCNRLPWFIRWVKQ